MTGSAQSISFVIPCLNERATIGLVLDKINRLREKELAGRETEIVVSDNGSTDGSVEVAGAKGARVVHCPIRGYGAALSCGIERATGDLVVFADADDTYDLLEAPRLIDELERHGADLVLGSRLDGEIHKGAMPFMHRRVGTPTLNLLINLLHAGGGDRVRDCNSGFRCFRRRAFLQWNVKSTGMEFASEMLVKALKSGARLRHASISLRAESSDRVPHLRTWRDGMRHLLQILLEAPEFFSLAGITMLLVSWAALLVGLIWGPISIGIASVFGLHTLMVALLGSCFGLSVWGIGLLLSVGVETRVRSYRLALRMGEARLFWMIVAFCLLGAGFFLFVLVQWARNDFVFLEMEMETLVLTAFGANGLFLVANIITAHMLKRVHESAVRRHGNEKPDS